MLRLWQHQDTTQGYLLMLPALLVLVAFLAYPFALGLYMSLTEWRVGGGPVFIGLDNFVQNWQTPTFVLALNNTLLITVVTTLAKLGFGLGLALLLNQEFRGRRFVRAAILLPWIVPVVLTGQAWKWMFDPNLSALNWILRNLGLVADRGIPWLVEANWALVSVMLVNTWRGIPFFAINFLAGLQTVPQELYEAAAIDGAGPMRKFFWVTLPLVMPVVIVVMLISTIGTISDFGIVWVLTSGGPAHATEVLGTWSYVVGLRSGDLGAGASVSLTMFPLLFLLVILNLYYVRRRLE